MGGDQRSVLGDGGVKGRRGRSEAGRRKEGRQADAALRCCWRRCRSRGHSRPLPPGRAGWAPQPRCLRSGPSFTARSSTRRCGRCPSATKTSPRSGPGPTAPSGEWRLRAGFCPGRRSAPLPTAPGVAAHDRWHRDIFTGEDNRVPAPSVISFGHISQCLLAVGWWGWRGCGLARPRAPHSSAAVPVSFWTRGRIVSRELRRAAASPGRRCKNHFSSGSASLVHCLQEQSLGSACRNKESSELDSVFNACLIATLQNILIVKCRSAGLLTSFNLKDEVVSGSR